MTTVTYKIKLFSNHILRLFKYLFLLIIFFDFVIPLERIIFINEALSLIGFIIFIITFKNINQDKLILSIYFITIYGLSHIVYGLFYYQSFYGYLRNTTICYTIFNFFLGTQIAKYFIYTQNQKNFGYFLAIPTTIIIGTYGINTNNLSLSSIFPILFRKYKWGIYLTILFSFIYTFNLGGTEKIKIISLIILAIIFKYKRLQEIIFDKKFIILLFYIFIVAIFSESTQCLYDNFISRDYKYTMIEKLDGPIIDGNVIWRLMFWAHLFKEKIINNFFFGVGFGQPLFGAWNHVNEFIWITIGENMDPYFQYTLGPHNFIVLIIARMGVIGIIPFIYFYGLIFDSIKTYDFNDEKNQLLKAFLLSFILITIAALFNVIVGSPLYAHIYWMLLGMLYQAIKHNNPKAFT